MYILYCVYIYAVICGHGSEMCIYILYSVYIFALLRGHWSERRAVMVEGAGLLAVMHTVLRYTYMLCECTVPPDPWSLD